VCFSGQKTREEREIWLKVRLFGFPDGHACEQVRDSATAEEDIFAVERQHTY